MWDTQAELELWADICQRNLYWFARVGAGLDHYPKVEGQSFWFCPRIHKPILDWIQPLLLHWLRAAVEAALIIEQARCRVTRRARRHGSRTPHPV